MAKVGDINVKVNVQQGIRWQKFLERKFIMAVGAIITGVLVAFGQGDAADTVDKVIGTILSLGGALGFIASETSRDNTRDGLAAARDLAEKATAVPLPSKLGE